MDIKLQSIWMKRELHDLCWQQHWCDTAVSKNCVSVSVQTHELMCSLMHRGNTHEGPWGHAQIILCSKSKTGRKSNLLENHNSQYPSSLTFSAINCWKQQTDGNYFSIWKGYVQYVTETKEEMFLTNISVLFLYGCVRRIYGCVKTHTLCFHNHGPWLYNQSVYSSLSSYYSCPINCTL